MIGNKLLLKEELLVFTLILLWTAKFNVKHRLTIQYSTRLNRERSYIIINNKVTHNNK